MGTAPGCIIAMLLLMVLTSPVQGQADSGSRVRITTSAAKSRAVVGTLISADMDSVRLVSARDRRLMALPVKDIIRVEQSVGRWSNAGRGAVIGALVGGGTGLILGLIASGEEDSWYEIGPGEIILVSAILGAGGAGVGALAGALTHHDQWEPVSLPSLTDKPAGARTIARFVIRF